MIIWEFEITIVMYLYWHLKIQTYNTPFLYDVLSIASYLIPSFNSYLKVGF